ncbi:serine protease 30-like [Pollicipes pollicipes]|uniref:serine protease 30-like n=1 Tax=Pollicipes pollicipes TaxID=41117 RepID=UPI0018852275|nr:serine protease 30-like [Pollicipes pollicipes]
MPNDWETRQQLFVSDTGCSLQNLCDPAAWPRVCFYNTDICDDIVDCNSGRDELYCDECLCLYRSKDGVTMDVPANAQKSWVGVNLRACARACNDVESGCVAFSFNTFSTSEDRCRLFFRSGRLLKRTGYELYVRETPSQPRLAPPPPGTTQVSSGPSAVRPTPTRPALQTLDPVFFGNASLSGGEPSAVFGNVPPSNGKPPTDVQNRVLLSSGVTNRVVSGHRASYGTYPWQAQVEAYNRAGYFEHHCGGVLIGSRHVLTAAHCITRVLSALQVKVGQHDRMDASEPHEQTFAIENVLSHPEYRGTAQSGYANDLAVVKLRLRQGRPVEFSDHVQPLCLPAADAPLQTGQQCEISGWGKTDVLLPDEVYGARFVAGRMVCAGHVAGGTDACHGDSGGPLACRSDDGRWLLTGVVSYGTGCGNELNPGVYTRVGFYVPWIRRVVQLL